MEHQAALLAGPWCRLDVAEYLYGVPFYSAFKLRLSISDWLIWPCSGSLLLLQLLDDNLKPLDCLFLIFVLELEFFDRALLPVDVVLGVCIGLYVAVIACFHAIVSLLQFLDLV